MISILKLIRNGSLEIIKTDFLDLETLSTYVNNGQTNIEQLDELSNYESNLKIFGSNNNHLLMENKHEIPYCFDRIFFGDLLIIKYNRQNVIENIDSKEYLDLVNQI